MCWHIQSSKALAFTRNPSDTSVSPATYTADGASELVLVDQRRDISIDGSDKADNVRVNTAALSSSALYNYNVRGFEGDDTFNFNATLIQNSVINGNVGNDTMTIGLATSNPTVNFDGSYFLGGKGNDALFAYDLSGGEVNGNIGNDTINVTNTYADRSFNQYVGGGQGNDLITVKGSFNNSIIDGNKGIDTIIVEDGTHSNTSVNGGEGNDIIRSSGDVTKGLMLSGDLGNDTIASEGSLGSTIFGGEGNDTIISSSVAGQKSKIDAGVGADFVFTDNSAAVETVIFNAGDSVAATASSLGTLPNEAIEGSITFKDGIDIIIGFSESATGSTVTNDIIEIDFDPTDYVLTQGVETSVTDASGNTTVITAEENALLNTDVLATDVVYAVQGDLDTDSGVFTVAYTDADPAKGITAGDVIGTDYIFIVGGGNLTLGQVFTNSTNMFISDNLIPTDQFQEA